MADRALTNENILLSLGAVAMAFALTLLLDPFQFSRGFSTDALAYLGHAHQLLRDHAFDMGPDNNTYSLVTQRLFPAGTPNFYTPPVYIAMLAAGLAIWNSWQVALIENAVVFALTVYLGLRLLAFQDQARFLRLAFAAAMVLDPAYLLYDGGVQLDTPAAMLTLAFILLWLEALRTPVLWKFIAAGLCGGAACLTRGNVLPVIGLTGLLSLAGYRHTLDRKRIKGILLTGLIGAVILGGWAWRTEQLTDVWSPTGSGNAGTMLALNFSLAGPRVANIQRVWPQKDAAAYAQSLQARGDAPLRQEVEMDREYSHQVMRYIAGHRFWAARIFVLSNVRLFLASEFSEPQLIAGRLGGGAVARAIGNLYVFGTRGILLASFFAFPWLMLRGAVGREFSWIWIAALGFVLITAFIAPGADRYRVAIEPLCVLFVALWAAHLRHATTLS
jgi:4-amino-4-deoxy-L-arabinose transferase-like glycosyltransferase